MKKEETKVVEEETLEEIEEETKEVVEEKEESKKDVKVLYTEKEKIKKPHIFRTIFNIIFWLAVLVLAFTWIMDFIKVKNNEKPQFCISNKTHEFDDGKVDECLGLGYKVYTYDRDSMTKGAEFVPFFMSMKEPEKD